LQVRTRILFNNVIFIEVDMTIGLEKFHGSSSSSRKEPLSFALIRQIGGLVFIF